MSRYFPLSSLQKQKDKKDTEEELISTDQDSKNTLQKNDSNSSGNSRKTHSNNNNNNNNGGGGGGGENEASVRKKRKLYFEDRTPTSDPRFKNVKEGDGGDKIDDDDDDDDDEEEEEVMYVVKRRKRDGSKKQVVKQEEEEESNEGKKKQQEGKKRNKEKKRKREEGEKEQVAETPPQMERRMTDEDRADMVSALSQQIVQLINTFQFPRKGNVSKSDMDQIRLQSLETAVNVLKVGKPSSGAEKLDLAKSMQAGHTEDVHSVFVDMHKRKILKENDYMNVFMWLAKKERLAKSPQIVVHCYNIIESSNIVPSVSMLNIIVDAYVHMNQFQRALGVIDDAQTKHGILPTKDTFVPLITRMLQKHESNSSTSDVDYGLAAHDLLIYSCKRGIPMPTKVFVDVVLLLCKRGDLTRASNVISKMGEGIVDNGENRQSQYANVLSMVGFLDAASYNELVRTAFTSMPKLLCGTTKTTKLKRKHGISLDNE